MISVFSAPTHLLVVGSFILLLALSFLGFFLVRGGWQWFRLGGVLKRLKQSGVGSAEALKSVFATDNTLAHLWKEYFDTLHAQKEERDGEEITVAMRSTVPAEVFFNNQYIVDSHLRTEFFKHLPGIFTGLGIIGTFMGLIQGLQAFQVSENPQAVRNSLESLLHGVHEAFFVSAVAIGLAMIVTVLEKLLLASLYKRVEAIAQDLDGRFEAGAGEEYLSRLVKASEDSASQSKILKDALVKDLKQILQEISEQQIASVRENNAQLGQAIGDSIREGLKEPLSHIAETVKIASGEQTGNASRMLQDVLTHFSQQLNEMFSGQISGINDLNQKTAQAMQQAVGTLNQLVANLEAASEKSGDAMAQRMAEALEKMEQRQESINQQTQAFVEQIKQLVASTQTETHQKLQETLAGLGDQVSAMIDALRNETKQALEQNRSREEQLAERTSGAVSAMTESVSAAVKEMSEASTLMQQSVATLAQSSGQAVDKMAFGAETLNQASKSFASAGERVMSIMNQAVDVTSKLTELSGALTSSSASLQTALNDYRSHRDAVTDMVGQLRALVDSAKKEATLTADVLSRIQSATDKLVAAQHEAEKYLDGITNVLTQAHQAFAEATMKTLDRANTEFHQKISSAVNLLGSSIQELETTLGSIPALN